MQYNTHLKKFYHFPGCFLNPTSEIPVDCSGCVVSLGWCLVWTTAISRPDWLFPLLFPSLRVRQNSRSGLYVNHFIIVCFFLLKMVSSTQVPMPLSCFTRCFHTEMPSAPIPHIISFDTNTDISDFNFSHYGTTITLMLQ